MTARDVLRVLRTLSDAEIEAWACGGWGIDALLREQTRQHKDIDICFRAEDDTRAISVLVGIGYALTDDHRPVRFVMSDHHGHLIDLHPIAFMSPQTGLQANAPGLPPFVYPVATAFAVGQIDGCPVACLSAAQQLTFHLGYQPKEKDRHDIAILCRRFGLAVPPPYRGDGAVSEAEHLPPVGRD